MKILTEIRQRFNEKCIQVRRERRAEAAKDAINRWKGTIEVFNDQT